MPGLDNNAIYAAPNPAADALRRKQAEQDAILAEHAQATAASKAAMDRAAAEEARKTAQQQMAANANQWTATPQYKIDWAHAPQEARQNITNANPEAADLAPELWNKAATLNGLIPGLENHPSVAGVTVAPDGGTSYHYTSKPEVSPALKVAASHAGIVIDPSDDADSIQMKMAQAQQAKDAEHEKHIGTIADAQKQRNDLRAWKNVVVSNPAAQTITKNLSTAERNLQSIEDNSKGQVTPAMQNNILTAYMGIEKPGVSPTNTDRESAIDTRGFWSGAGMHAKNILTNSGDILTKGQINQMKAAARLTLESYRREYTKHVASAVNEALKLGYDPNLVIAPGVYDPKTKQIHAPSDPNAIHSEIPENGDTAPSTSAAQPQPGNGTTAPATPVIPKPGEVRDGYRFKGGAPHDKNNWEKLN